MLKIGITGYNGFLAFNLRLRIKAELVNYQLFNVDLRENSWDDINNLDILFHFAGVNRTNGDIVKENLIITNKLLLFLDSTKVSKLCFSNSTQIYLDNEYSKSKKDNSKILKDYCSKSSIQFFNAILPNLCGPFGKENYNSFINTFIFNIKNNIKSSVNKNSKVKLIDVDSVSKALLKNVIYSINGKEILFDETKEYLVLDVYNRIKNIITDYQNGYFPKLSDKMDTILYNSYICSFNAPVVSLLTTHNDNRGSFCELSRTLTRGQFSISTTKHNIVRGNHFHLNKPERFIYYSGSLEIKLRKLFSNEIIILYYEDDIPRTIDIPIGFTHNLRNIGNTDLIMYFFTPDFFNPENPDTYPHEV